MQHVAALFHEVEDMLRKILALLFLVSLGIGLSAFEGCQLTPTMEEIPEEVEAETSSSDEMNDALELAQEDGALIVESSLTKLVVCFDNAELAKTYTRRVNQATKTLRAVRTNLCVEVTVRG